MQHEVLTRKQKKFVKKSKTAKASASTQRLEAELSALNEQATGKIPLPLTLSSLFNFSLSLVFPPSLIFPLLPTRPLSSLNLSLPFFTSSSYPSPLSFPHSISLPLSSNEHPPPPHTHTLTTLTTRHTLPSNHFSFHSFIQRASLKSTTSFRSG